MRFSFDALKEFISVHEDASKLAIMLTSLGLEVEGIEKEGKEIIFEVGLTPNLAHAESLLGVARELSALTGEKVRLPVPTLKESKEAISSHAHLTVEASDLCPRYLCRVITGVKVAPSPPALVKRLEQAGRKSVNNIVDVTNLVLLELGHPLHAFDLHKLRGNSIVVRAAKEGESLVTLDGKERRLTPSMLVIADKERAQAIAGVMGGHDSAVSETTTSILLEAAYFDSTSVRRTSKALNLHTDASRRFERGVDPHGPSLALERAAALIVKYAGGEVSAGVMERSVRTFTPRKVAMRIARVPQLLGIDLGKGEMETIFKRLHFEVRGAQDDVIEVVVPTYRGDIKEEIDLIEEIARLYGYDNIYQNKRKVMYRSSSLPHNPSYLFETKVRSHLIAQGLQELLTCNLISEQEVSAIRADQAIRVKNPTSREHAFLRPSLLPALLSVVKHNLDHGIDTLAGFEVGRVYFQRKEKYVEPSVVSLVWVGKKAPHHFSDKSGDADLLDMKGVVENLFSLLKVEGIRWERASLPTLHPGRCATALFKQEHVGTIGEVHPAVLKAWGIDKRVLFAEINLDDLRPLCITDIKMQPQSAFPATVRDWTVTLDAQETIGHVEGLIEQRKSPLLEHFFLLDSYEGGALTPGCRNVTFRFVYRDSARTLSFEEAQEEHQRITGAVLDKLTGRKR